MTKIALITDLHLGYKENTSQSKAMYEYLIWFFEDLKKRNITNIFILGDIFDNRESINFLTIHNTYKNFINPIIEGNFNTYIAAGNHDCFYKNTNEIYSFELLFSRIENFKKHFHLVKNECERFIIDTSSILLTPWINSQNYQNIMDDINNSNDDYLMGHFEINGFTMVKGIKCSNGIKQEVFKKFKKVFSGHFHLRENIGNISYIGTPYEKDWNDHCFPKGYTILDLDTDTVEFVVNNNNYFVTIEYDENATIDEKSIENKEVKFIINSVNKQSELNKFLEELYRSNPSKLQIIDNTSLIKNKDDDENEIINYQNNDNIEIFKNYVENLDLDENINKDEIKNILINVYNESISKWLYLRK